MMGSIMSCATTSRECIVHIVLMLMVLMMLGLGEKGGVVDALSQVPTLSELGYAWPKGTYAIPVIGAGKCPGVSGYEDEEEWRTGQLVQDVVHEWRDGVGGGMRIAEGRGGRGSGLEDGIGGGRDALTVAREAKEAKDQAKISFCTKTVSGEYSASDFMPGRYCLWKKNDCPTDFYEGWIQLDHTLSTTTVSSGVLPDGTYDNRTVLIGFCCRSDGEPGVGIRLPDVRPFALLRLGHSPCQAVNNMDVSEASSSLEGVATVSDGLSPELDSDGGDGGDLEGTVASVSNRTRVWSCIYRPRNCSGRCLAAFLDVFFVCFVVMVVVLAVCLQMRKRCSVKRGASARASSSSSSTTKQLHFFYDSDEDDDDDDDDVNEGERYEPLLPFYHRRRCPVGRDHGELGLCRGRIGSGVDSRTPSTASVLVARLPTQPSTDDDDDGDESNDDEDDDEEEEDIAWDVTVIVQLPQQQTASPGNKAMGRKDEAVPMSSADGAGNAGGRGSPPPPYEEASAAVGDAALSGGMTEASASSVAGDDDATMMEMEKKKMEKKQAQ